MNIVRLRLQSYTQSFEESYSVGSFQESMQRIGLQSKGCLTQFRTCSLFLLHIYCMLNFVQSAHIIGMIDLCKFKYSSLLYLQTQFLWFQLSTIHKFPVVLMIHFVLAALMCSTPPIAACFCCCC